MGSHYNKTQCNKYNIGTILLQASQPALTYIFPPNKKII